MSSNFIDKYIPSTLYEIIAYFCSGILFVALGSVAMLDQVTLKKVTTYLFTLDLHEQIGLTVLLGILTYAYGQLSSTLSAPFIADPVSKFVKKLGRWTSSDFKTDFSNAVTSYGLADNLPSSKVNNKWTLMFYLQVKHPEIGKDIMKRYAREKLARINAFNMLLLTFLAIISIIGKDFGMGQKLGLGNVLQATNIWWIIIYIILVITYSYEYYKRKCWNNDLLLKVLPVTKST